MILSGVRYVQLTCEFEFDDAKVARLRWLAGKAGAWTVEEEREYLALEVVLVDAHHDAFKTRCIDEDWMGSEIWVPDDEEPLVDWG